MKAGWIQGFNISSEGSILIPRRLAEKVKGATTTSYWNNMERQYLGGREYKYPEAKLSDADEGVMPSMQDAGAARAVLQLSAAQVTRHLGPEAFWAGICCPAGHLCWSDEAADSPWTACA